MPFYRFIQEKMIRKIASPSILRKEVAVSIINAKFSRFSVHKKWLRLFPAISKNPSRKSFECPLCFYVVPPNFSIGTYTYIREVCPITSPPKTAKTKESNFSKISSSYKTLPCHLKL